MDNRMRAVALYRVSTKQQTGKDANDIPIQKEIVRGFIVDKKWDLIREFTEGGVSGFKKSESERDALQAIKAMALDHVFDVLVVYMSDRIGRIARETPLVIDFLNQNGVKVWSVSEGEINTRTHAGKLLTYIRYWQNEGESLKTVKRVSDYHKEMVKSGRFRGGNMIPYGYQLVDNGTTNFKGRLIKDFIIDENEAEIVKLIYSLSIDKNYGQHRTAKYLNGNGITNRDGRVWYASTIQNILNNQIYKGQYHMYSSFYQEEITSPIQEELVIIPKERWELNQRAMEKRSHKRTKKGKYATSTDTRPQNTHGKMLLSGIAYCGHCGERLTTLTSYKRWTTADGEKHSEVYYRYRCGSFYKRDGVKCNGQSTYGTTRVEPEAIKQVKNFMLELEHKQLDNAFIEEFDKQIKLMQQRKTEHERSIFQINRELQAIKDEIVKCLLGESKFTSDMLNELIGDKNRKLDKAMEAIQNSIDVIEELKVNRHTIVTLDQEFHAWGRKLDEADFETQKVMLSNVVDKVMVYRDRIELVISLPYQTYKENSIHMICREDQE